MLHFPLNDPTVSQNLKSGDLAEWFSIFVAEQGDGGHVGRLSA